MNNKNIFRDSSFRRLILDQIQNQYKHLYKGVVLDIGGRDRGKFLKPKNSVEKWIFADINSEYNPDIVIDVTDMQSIESNSIDTINAIELFEHVKYIEKALKECYRVLKKEGLIIISIPFLYHIHADPYDFQRWTYNKWIFTLNEIGFTIEKFIIMGKYFTTLSENLRFLIKATEYKSRFLYKILTFLIPFLRFIIKFDSSSFVRNNKILNNYHNGYFIIAKKLS
ncbi:MAG: methyltransferase domain-containing protein [Promethearchaeota archaeon]